MGDLARMNAFRHFYYDIALSTTATALHGLLEITTPDHVLYGSDFPYAPLFVGVSMTKRWDELLQRDEFKALRSANAQSGEGLFGDLERFTYK